MFNIKVLVDTIRKIGEAIPNINTVILSDIYQLNSLPDVEYSCFCITQGRHRADDEYFYFNFVLFYVDRLLVDKSNQLEIQSHGIQLLKTVTDKLDELGLIINGETDKIYQVFTQRFSDECAGAYVELEIQVPIDCQIPYPILVDPLLGDLTVYQPGTYLPSDYGLDGFRVVDVSGLTWHYYSESGTTASINNGKHNLAVEQSGVYVDGKEVTTNDVLSGYTYNKETTNNLIQAALEGFDDVIAQVSANTTNISANTADISTISAMTSANTSDIQDIMQRISGLTGDYVAKQPTFIDNYHSEPGYIFDFDTYITTGYYVLEGMSSANTLNWPGDGGNAVLHAICYYKENEQGSFLDDAVQIYFTADNDTSDTRIYMRRHFWDDAQQVNIWGPWVLLSGGGSGGQIDTQMDDNSTNPVQNKVIKKYVDDYVGAIDTILQTI